MKHLIAPDGLAGASFEADPDRALYRYDLWRIVPGTDGTERVLFVMLNPSTARHDIPDPTITRCLGFAKRLGAGRLDVVNLFAFRATNPEDLDLFLHPVGPDNDEVIMRAAEKAEMVVCAWGAKKAHRHPDRAQEVVEILRAAGHPTLHCLGETKAGHPRHPLYLASATELQVFAK
jgi:hypothetical protein